MTGMGKSGASLARAAAFLCLLAGSLQAEPVTGAATDGWSRIYLSDDFTTEWLASNDTVFVSHSPSEQTTLYILFPPIVTPVGNHWEITFDPAGKKKAQLAEHFDTFTSPHYHGARNPFEGRVRMSLACSLDGKGYDRFWLAIRSKNDWAGRPEELNADPEHTGTLYEFNLDPTNALGIAFLEPTVKEVDGEWLITTTAPSTPGEVEAAANRAIAWSKAHPRSHAAMPPSIHYPPKIQARYDAWWKALREWQQAGGNGLSPKPEDFLLLTPDQQKQWDAWERARGAWALTGGRTGPFPQPTDYLQDVADPAGTESAPSPPPNP